MKIDKNKLIDLLVEKTDMEREEIKDQLDQLIERILDAAKRGKALEIKEFGFFYFDEEGELSFDPAEELSTEISFKYAGMKPVELKPERDTSIYEPEETGEEKQYDEWEDEEEDEKVKKEEEQTDPFETAEPESKGIEKEPEIADDSLYDPFAPEAMEPLEEPVEEEPASKMEDIKPVSRQPVKKRKDNTGVFILMGIILIAVIIGGYFYYIGTQTLNLDEQAEAAVPVNPNSEPDENASADERLAATETEPQASQEMADESQTTTEQQNPDQVSEEQIVSDTNVSISETEQPLYGLKGSVVEEANINGYSIVLHSFRTEDRAMTAAERLRQDGYRVIITSRTVYENMVWRVSVGQFESLRDAQQATTQLPSPYNTQNFIHRIRT